jgi:hypothetical protein
MIGSQPLARTVGARNSTFNEFPCPFFDGSDVAKTPFWPRQSINKTKSVFSDEIDRGKSVRIAHHV